MQIYNTPRRDFQEFLKSPLGKGYFIPNPPFRRNIRIKKRLFFDRVSAPYNIRSSMQTPKAKVQEPAFIRQIKLVSRNKSERVINKYRNFECQTASPKCYRVNQSTQIKHAVVTLPSVNYLNYNS